MFEQLIHMAIFITPQKLPNSSMTGFLQSHGFREGFLLGTQHDHQPSSFGVPNKKTMVPLARDRTSRIPRNCTRSYRLSSDPRLVKTGHGEEREIRISQLRFCSHQKVIQDRIHTISAQYTNIMYTCSIYTCIYI